MMGHVNSVTVLKKEETKILVLYYFIDIKTQIRHQEAIDATLSVDCVFFFIQVL